MNSVATSFRLPDIGERRRLLRMARSRHTASMSMRAYHRSRTWWRKRCARLRAGQPRWRAGLTFSSGTLLPESFRNSAFVGEHGSWIVNRQWLQVVFIPVSQTDARAASDGHVLNGFLATNGDRTRSAGRASPCSQDGGSARRQTMWEYDLARPTPRPDRSAAARNYERIGRYEQNGGLARGHGLSRQLSRPSYDGLERGIGPSIAYVITSRGPEGAERMTSPRSSDPRPAELQHALTISRQIDLSGQDARREAEAGRVSDKPREMLQFDLDNENETIRNYRTASPV